VRAVLRLAGGLLFCTALGASVANADSGALERVERYLTPLTTLSANFSQVVRNRDGDIIERSQGSLAIRRPDRFRWEYREPNEQTIVADGKRLWLYDRDLEQVTVRTLTEGLGSTPAMLLSGGGDIGAAFSGDGVQTAGDWTWCRLKPRQADSDFESVSLAFDAKGELAGMELRDKLGQSTVVEFSSVRRNQRLDDALFQFEPPPGADVIGDAAG